MFTKKNYKNKADALIVSDDLYPQSRETLKNLGIKTYNSYENNFVSRPLSKHVDMQLVHLYDNQYICAAQCYEYYKEISDKCGFVLLRGVTDLSSNYPADIAYNIIVTEKYAVHNFKYTDIVLKQNIEYKKMINVSQGYTGCTVCKIGEDAFITSDNGVYRLLSNEGCNVLLIAQGDILLPGYDCGFIGGATFMIAHNLLAVNGNINLHPDCDRIVSFCKDFGVEVLSLANRPIMDIGSAVAL